MPPLVWRYLTALLSYRTSTSCVALAEALETVSHDRLTRLWQADWSGQTLLELAVRTLFVRERGYLILDDTVIRDQGKWDLDRVEERIRDVLRDDDE